MSGGGGFYTDGADGDGDGDGDGEDDDGGYDGDLGDVDDVELAVLLAMMFAKMEMVMINVFFC